MEVPSYASITFEPYKAAGSNPCRLLHLKHFSVRVE